MPREPYPFPPHTGFPVRLCPCRKDGGIQGQIKQARIGMYDKSFQRRGHSRSLRNACRTALAAVAAAFLALPAAAQTYANGLTVESIDPDADAVGEGIAHWVENRPDPWKVRAAWLAKAGPHRDAFRKLMRELTGRGHGRPPHKLALRTPHPGIIHSLAIQTYLALKAVVAK